MIQNHSQFVPPCDCRRYGDVSKWRVQGDWFDTCNCSVPCPCTFAQPPTTGLCEGILAWHIRQGNYGDARLDGLSVIALGTFKGNIWEGQAHGAAGQQIAPCQGNDGEQRRNDDQPVAPGSSLERRVDGHHPVFRHRMAARTFALRRGEPYVSIHAVRRDRSRTSPSWLK